MKPNWIVFSLLVLLAYFNAPCNAEVRRLLLRPMTGNEVYKVLQDAGREDAIPEGRIITQGIAAATGLGLGIIKGIGGSILFDLATSNETQQYLSNMMGGWFVHNGNTDSTNSTPPAEQQEICFNSRSLNEIDDEYDEELSRQITTGTTRDIEEGEIESVAEGRQATTVGAVTSPTLPDTGLTSTSTPEFETSPSLTLPTSGTKTSTLTSPSGGGSFINCIVINKQEARKRRRRSLNNKLIKHTRRSKRYSRRS